MIHFTHHFQNIPQPSSQDADKLFNQISEELTLSISHRPVHRAVFNLIRAKYYLIRILFLLLLLLIITFTIYFLNKPASIQDINITPISYNTQKVSFQIPNSFWIKSITASQNHIPLSVNQENNGYSIDVTKNGILLIEIETISHVRIQQEIIIEDIDDEAPYIQSHYQDGHEIIIYLSDGNGSGIDWNQIVAHTQKSNIPIKPSYYDSSKNLIIFSYPKETIQILIPDLAGNYCTALLEPK